MISFINILCNMKKKRVKKCFAFFKATEVFIRKQTGIGHMICSFAQICKLNCRKIMSVKRLLRKD